ncbi:MAG: MFS transporter [Chloroflexota bacterium]
MKEYLELLKKRPGFRNLWFASVVSLLGDWFNTIASVMIVNRYTETDLAISWILIAKTLPRFFLGPLAGVLADRVNRKWVMFASDVLRAGIVLSFLFVDRPERVWLIYALTVAQFIVASFFEPASSAILPGLVEGEEELVTANVLSSITWSAMLALGAAAGGVVAGLFGAEAALVIDSGTFLVSAVLVLRVKYDQAAVETQAVTSGFRDLIDGFKYVVKERGMGFLVMIKSIGQIGSGDILMVVFAERYFPLGEEGATSLGIMFAAAGLGSIIGPLIARVFSGTTSGQLRGLIQKSYLLIPLGWIIFALAPSLWVVCVGAAVRMMGVSINWTYSNVLIQYQVPDRFLGRVFSIDLGLFTLANSTSVLLTGIFLDSFRVEPRGMLTFFAAASFAMGVVLAITAGRQRGTKKTGEA